MRTILRRCKENALKMNEPSDNRSGKKETLFAIKF